MLMRIREGACIEVGCCFYRYYPKLNHAYDKGEVTSCLNGQVEVDFGDTLVRFLQSDIVYVINTDTCDEHHMTLESGKLIADYRSAPKGLDEPGSCPVLASFEELLNRI